LQAGSAHHNSVLLFGCQETQRLKAEPVPGIEATPDESNARYFHVVVVGPRDVCHFRLM